MLHRMLTSWQSNMGNLKSTTNAVNGEHHKCTGMCDYVCVYVYVIMYIMYIDLYLLERSIQRFSIANLTTKGSPQLRINHTVSLQ